MADLLKRWTGSAWSVVMEVGRQYYTPQGPVLNPTLLRVLEMSIDVPVQYALFGTGISCFGNLAVIGSYIGNRVDVFDLRTGDELFQIPNPSTTEYSNAGNDFFGIDVNMSDKYIVVGARNALSVDSYESGVAYVFDSSDGTLLHTLINPSAVGTETNDVFGRSVSITDKYVVVGAPYESNISGNSGNGAVYIFNVITGSLIYSIINPMPFNRDMLFGYSVDVYGEYCVIGEPYHNENYIQLGKAYVYNMLTGTIVHELQNPNNDSVNKFDEFGNSVAISDAHVVIGAKTKRDDQLLDVGIVYVFDSLTGELVYSLKNPNNYGSPAYDLFGSSLSLYGNYLLVGAPGEGRLNTATTGVAYLYDMTDGELIKTFIVDEINANSRFGDFVSICDQYCMVSANREDRNGMESSGGVYIYELYD